MGMYGYGEICIGARSFDSCARQWDLPRGTYDDYSYTVQLTAKEVKAWVDEYYRYYEELTTRGQVGAFSHYDLLLLKIGPMLESHALAYINKVSSEMIEGETPRARRDRLRKATRKYRFIFG